MPDDEEIEIALHNNYYPNYTSTGILYMLETRLRNEQLEASKNEKRIGLLLLMKTKESLETKRY